MKIVHFNTFEGGGGAAKASLALHRAMLDLDVDASLIVHRKTSADPTVIGGPPTRFGPFRKKLLPWVLSKLHHLWYRPLEVWTFGVFGNRSITRQREVEDADIISLSWVSWFLDIEAIGQLLKKNKPVVWTCYDMWPFTGGCHYDNLCGRYEISCGKCPVIRSNKANDVSHKTLQRKLRSWAEINLTIVTPSKWLANCAKKSSLFKEFQINVIPNTVNLGLFKPWDKEFARDILRLPQDKLLILAGALNIQSDPRKGFHYLLKALTSISSENIAKDIEIIIAGSMSPQTPLQLDLPIHYLGFLHDEISMALAYSAADIFVAPSMQDNLPNTIIESLACGTPCAAFDIGGMPDMIQHKRNGYLAAPFEAEDLAAGLVWMLNSTKRLNELSQDSRNKALQDYNPKKITDLHIQIYKKLLSS